jgi:GNAT superfamily N-acetyltransferase
MEIARWRQVLWDVRWMPPLLLAQKLLRHMPLRLVNLGQLCFLRLEGVPRVPPALLRGDTTVRRATLDDLAGLVQLVDKPEVFRARFAIGDHCVIALSRGRIVGYEWFCERPVHREEVWGLSIDIPRGFVYAYDAHIDPAYRNTGVWLRFKAFLGEWMTEAGKLGVLTFVEYGNWPSLRTHIRFGFQPFDTVLAINVLGVKMFRKLQAIGSSVWMYMMCALLSRGTIVVRPLHTALGSAREHGALAHTLALLLRVPFK